MTNLSETTLLAFVDGELDATATEEIAQQLAHDRTAAEMVRTLRSSAALVRAAFAEPACLEVPPRLAALVEARGPRQWLAGRRQFAAALGASLAACAAGLAAGVALERPWPQHMEAGERLLAEVAEYHTDFAGEASRLGIAPASKAAEIRSWFAAVLGRPVPIPPLDRFGLTFQGARLLVADGQPVTQLLYAARGKEGQPLGVCITAWSGAEVPLRTERRDGVALALWARAGYAYVLVGWTEPARLKTMATALRRTLEQT